MSRAGNDTNGNLIDIAASAIYLIRNAAYLVDDDDVSAMLIKQSYQIERDMDLDVMRHGAPLLRDLKLIFLLIRDHLCTFKATDPYVLERYDEVMPFLSYYILEQDRLLAESETSGIIVS